MGTALYLVTWRELKGEGVMEDTVYAYSIIQELKKDISDFVAYKERCQFGCDGGASWYFLSVWKLVLE